MNREHLTALTANYARKLAFDFDAILSRFSLKAIQGRVSPLIALNRANLPQLLGRLLPIRSVARSSSSSTESDPCKDGWFGTRFSFA